MAHEKALKQAIGEQAKEEADIKYQETLEQARKVRDEVMDEAQKAFTIACGQSDDLGDSREEKSCGQADRNNGWQRLIGPLWLAK